MKRIYIALFFCLPFITSTNAQTTVVLDAVADNTIYEENPTYSNGAGQNFFAGNNNGSSHRRSLIKFDLSAIPAGANITAATLTLFCNRTQTGPDNVSIHKLFSSWGEGTSDAAANEGGGTPAAVNDATWNSRFNLGAAWNTPGGDFNGTAAATSSVGASNAGYTWSSPAMINDIQTWVNDASINFGWIIIGTETGAQTAKRFASRQNGNTAQRPTLSVTYNIAVPVVLSSFKAKEVKTGVLLSWETSQELNNDFFSVEHSTDGVNFRAIGTVKGRGTVFVTSAYQFRHEGISAGRHFYRLAQTDIAGKVQLSAIRSVNISKQVFSLQVNPNPVRDKIILTSSVNTRGNRFSIINGSGSVVMGGSLNINGIDVKSLAPGTYYLKIQQQDGNVVTGMFLKQ